MKTIQYMLYGVWFVVIITFILGISLPIATVKKFLVFDNQFSLLGSISDLTNQLNAQNLFLLVIIILFTLVFPVAKLLTMFFQIKHYGHNWQNRMTRLVETIGHFSMVDVFVIALMVLLLKLRVLVDVNIHIGFYWFTASIVLSILLSFAIKQLRGKSVTMASRQAIEPTTGHHNNITGKSSVNHDE